MPSMYILEPKAQPPSLNPYMYTCIPTMTVKLDQSDYVDKSDNISTYKFHIKLHVQVIYTLHYIQSTCNIHVHVNFGAQSVQLNWRLSTSLVDWP